MSIRVVIETAEPLVGTAVARGRPPLPFAGWLELLRAIAQLVDSSKAPTGEQHDPMPRAALPMDEGTFPRKEGA